uniref:Glucosamine 6-phosphate N-acetyltransferase n=1 Tax=Mesocestoides corti TaxID=53468 RepID=A0A5K3FAP8_MESCO
MAEVFDPEVLRGLKLGSALEEKGVTLDPFDVKSGLLLRPLKSTDLDYLRLLKQLTVVGNVSPDALEGRCKEFFSRPNTYFIVVLEDLQTHRIVGCATLLVELKVIHGLSKRGHIEDVVVDEAFRGKGLGQLLITVLVEIGRAQGCYKISLDCDHDKVAFYGKKGFKQETVSMCLRLHD